MHAQSASSGNQRQRFLRDAWINGNGSYWNQIYFQSFVVVLMYELFEKKLLDLSHWFLGSETICASVKGKSNRWEGTLYIKEKNISSYFPLLDIHRANYCFLNWTDTFHPLLANLFRPNKSFSNATCIHLQCSFFINLLTTFKLI